MNILASVITMLVAVPAAAANLSAAAATMSSTAGPVSVAVSPSSSEPPRHTRLHPSACEDQADCTAELQAALDRGGTIHLACTVGSPWITGPLNVTRNNTWLGLDAGCELLAKEGSFVGTFAPLLSIRSAQAPAGCRSACTPSGELKPGFPGANAVRNISVVGVGGQATLRMRRADYNSTKYTHSEHRHGIAILGQPTGTSHSVFDVTIRNLNITLTGGDGVYVVGLDGGHIQRVHHTANYRQGSSVIDARHVLYEDCTFTGTRGTPPMAGESFHTCNKFPCSLNECTHTSQAVHVSRRVDYARMPACRCRH